MFTRKVFAAGLLSVALLMAGCGARNEVTGTDPANDTGAITEPTVPTTPADPGTQPNNPPAQPPDQPVTASVEKAKTGGFLFWFKKIKASVTVTNPNAKSKTVKLTVTFSKGGSSVETHEETVTLSAGENKIIEVKSTKTADDATAYVSDDSGAPSGGGAAGNTPAPGAGGTTGTSGPGTMAGTPGGSTAGTGGMPY